ncbi:MAG: response regulator transcription factor [Actinomycetota bacterium]
MARILIADDDADVRQVLVVALVDRGHEVAAARDGAVAVRMLTEGTTPDLVVLDVMMPLRDGFQVLDELTNSGLRDLTRVIMLTANGSEHDASRIFELGADAYSTKPFDLDELIAQIEELLALSNEELKSRRERELDTSRLLSQLESILGDG